MKKSPLLASVAALASFTAAPALAQERATVDEQKADAPGGPDIVVTAQKRTERLQEVPISIVAVSGDELDRQSIANFEDLNVPGAKISRGGRADTFTVRGIGSGQNLGFAQSAPMYIDGVYYGRARVQRLGFLDLERIEILKGPQPTFFGRNAIAGAINITSRTGTEAFEGYAEGSYEFITDEIAGSAALSGPLSDGLTGRIALSYRNSQGYITNVGTGNREPQSEDLIGRASLAYTAGPLNLRLTGYYGGNNDVGRNNQTVICSATFIRNFAPAAQEDCTLNRTKASFGGFPAGSDQRYFFDGGGASFFNRLRIRGANLKADYDIGNGVTLTSLTAYYAFKNQVYTDSDQAIANVLNTTFTERFDQFSQELRLASAPDQPFTWFAGAYYDRSNSKLDIGSSTDFAKALPGSPLLAMVAQSGSSISNLDDNEESWALFGEGAYSFTEALKLKVGLRYESISKDEYSFSCVTAVIHQPACSPLPANNFIANFALNNKRFTPAVTLEYKPARDILLYASFKQGFKSGGFSQDGTGAFQPEKVNAYEVGAKTQFWDRRITVNLAAFRADYDDLQVSSFDAATLLTTVNNAASARSQGIEGEVRFVPLPGLTFSGNVSYLDTKYVDYRTAPCFLTQTVAQGCIAAGGISSQNLSGKRAPYAAEWSGALSATYTSRIGSGLKGSVGADMFFSSSFATLGDLNPNSVQTPYQKYNARIAVGTSDDRYEIALVGRNLSDTLTSGFRNAIPRGAGAISSFTELPRTITVQVRTRF